MTIRNYITILLTISCFNLISQNFELNNLSSEVEFKGYFNNKILSDYDDFEGIYYLTIEAENYINGVQKSHKKIGLEKIVIVRDGSCYKHTVIEAGVSLRELNCTFMPTSSPYTFIYLGSKAKGGKFTRDKNGSYSMTNELDSEAVAKMWKVSEKEVKMYNYRQIVFYSLDKIYPTLDIINNILKSKESEDAIVTGTGFAITKTGLVVTSNHVVNGKKQISIRGVNGNMDALEGKVILNDENNDIAIIKIIDKSFVEIKNIPYNINTQLSKTGDEIFVLGFPLRSTMGDEIKLTTGVISSRTGFKGDLSSYQISAPVQPGSSGGPVFNRNGEVIGLISSKHTEAEGASYAVKSFFLLNIIELLPEETEIQSVNYLQNKDLSTQVSILKDFVFIIECK